MKNTFQSHTTDRKKKHIVSNIYKGRLALVGLHDKILYDSLCTCSTQIFITSLGKAVKTTKNVLSTFTLPVNYLERTTSNFGFFQRKDDNYNFLKATTTLIYSVVFKIQMKLKTHCMRVGSLS